jgi:hypothetical protein
MTLLFAAIRSLRRIFTGSSRFLHGGRVKLFGETRAARSGGYPSLAVWLQEEAMPVNDNLKVVLGILGGAIVVLLLFAALAGGGMGGMGQMMGGGMFGGLFMLLFWGLLIALIVVLIVWIVRQM